MRRSEERKTARTKLRNLTHPILVKKSYLYLGIPPLTKTIKAISRRNFNEKTRAEITVYLRGKEGTRVVTFVTKPTKRL